MKHVLLMTNELATVAAVTTALESNGQLDPGDVCRDLTELTERLEHQPIPAVLVDIDEQPQRILNAIEPLAKRFTATRFAILSGSLDPDLLLLAMRSGVNNFVEKRSLVSDLAGVLKKLCPPAESAPKGSLVTVLSAGGGCGATTFAVNLADELARVSPGADQDAASLVVDLDFCYGAVGSYLSLDSEFGLLDLLSRTDPIDAQLIRSTIRPGWPQVHALLGSARGRMGNPVDLDEQRFADTLEACKSAYRWTVLDAPRLPATIAGAAVRHSDATFLLMQLTIKDLRVARQMMAGLSAYAPGTTVQVLVSRYCRGRQLISLEEAARALGLTTAQPLVCLHNDFRAVSRSMNFGKPLAELAKRSKPRRDFQKLAAQLVQNCQPREK